MARREIGRRGVLGLGLGVALAGCQATPAPTPTTTPTTPPPTSTAPPGPAPTPTTPTGPPAPAGPAQQFVRSESGRQEIALTFHGAGELSITRHVLDLLAQHDAQVTVLAVGTWLASTPDGIRMVRDGGHEIGNHTWSHGDLAKMAPNPMLTEIERCRDELARITGGPGTFFRQSQGQYATPTELAEAAKAGYQRVLSYDVDSLDWTDPAPEKIRRAVAAARAGSVVSMHLGHPATVSALPGVLADLAGRGLKPVTATRMFT